ncbi:hypothetical protein [Dictyobacter aurantiacus]|uniref:Uncharacterized protein n=1 Tax=Dictyobacter aurantiacus TaxID=1936993 RepID=A0A401ZFY6_9CHLR|nr:hypothetical protein [Dictyobacter aurantiacus]GCE05791.1 hypothetical protein KDAU_31200 [Dictyobacter aurantiacus]
MDFLLSCISTRHSMLKNHWAQNKQAQQEQQTECPVTVLGSLQKPKDDQGGLLCLLNDKGEVQAGLDMSMPAGMVSTDDGFLVATMYEVHRVSRDLSTVQPSTISLPSFNLLHSLSRSQRGYLVASTGLDVIVEFSESGERLWDWWAVEHGFELTPGGEPRYINKDEDYRGVKFGTLAQTTHVNSVAELPDGTILATLFHQGRVIAIDRASGTWRTVLDGLDHPHSVRILNEDYITIADTGRGCGLLVNIKGLCGTIEARVDAQTSWLQDCSYDYRNDLWVLVDGKNTRIVLRSGAAGEKPYGQIDLNPEWRLYEALPLVAVDSNHLSSLHMAHIQV